MIENLTKETFVQKVFDYETRQEWAYQGDKPCIIDFWAAWCGPCLSFAPVFEQLSNEYAGDILFYKINTEEEQELSAVFGIRSIPSILFIPSTGKPQMATGALPPSAMREAIQEILFQTPVTESK